MRSRTKVVLAGAALGAPILFLVAGRGLIGPAAPSARLVGKLEGHEYAVTLIVFSPDGKTLVSAVGNAMLVWELSP